MEESLAAGVAPDRVALVTFTRAAAQVARERACRRFNLEEKDMPFIRTIHSLCFHQLALRRDDVLTEENLSELAEVTGEMMTHVNPDGDAPATRRNADALLTVDHYYRTTMRSLRSAWEDHGGELDWFRLKRFCLAYQMYKADLGLMDFTDMLTKYLTSAPEPVPVEIAIIDEGQDLTPLQWAVVHKAFRDAREMYVAGDDLQSIHRWAGAAEDYFLSLPFEREVLPLSHRLPRAIFDFSEAIGQRVSHRYEKTWDSAGRAGQVDWVPTPEEVDLSSGTWLLLARTNAQLKPLVQLAREQGVVYRQRGMLSVDVEHVMAIQAYEALRAGKQVSGTDADRALRAAGIRMTNLEETRSYTATELRFETMPIWHDALVRIPLDMREYYLACLRRGESLTRPPRVSIETIHGSKGAEAERVLLTTDMTYRTQRGYELDPDSEHRVFYVGATRASEQLTLVAPQTAYGYPI
jgi:superfamily I DNA/RNA helicase